MGGHTSTCPTGSRVPSPNSAPVSGALLSGDCITRVARVPSAVTRPRSLQHRRLPAPPRPAPPRPALSERHAMTRCCASRAANFGEVALVGILEGLQWARAHDCSWDEARCAVAARYGHLGVLTWAREHGCPWGEVMVEDIAEDIEEDLGEQVTDCCALAAEGGHLVEVLVWARAHGCPWSEDLQHLD